LARDIDDLTADMQIDRQNLYREETFTDLRVGSLKRLTPVKADGSTDTHRSVRYVGHTQLLSEVGPLPISCEIEAASLEEAMDKFPEAVRRSVERVIDEVKEYQRQQASQIVVPGAGPAAGKIKLP